MAQNYQPGYNSFSGADMKAVFANKVVGTLQGISYSIQREKAPIYTMGSADPRSFSRGKRGIAGSLIFIVFDKHAILSELGYLAPANDQLWFQSDIDDIRPEFRQQGSDSFENVSLTSSASNTPSNTVDNQESPLSSVGSDQELAAAWYADQIPPFDITVAACNEYGHRMVMSIRGVELLNEGSGISIDDIVTEQQHSYVARTIIPWTPVDSNFVSQIASRMSAAK